MSEVDSSGGTPEVTASGENQGQVSYETFQKVLKEKKNIQAKFADVEAKLSRLAELEERESLLERQKLEEQGKYKDVLDKANKELMAEKEARKKERSAFADSLLKGEIKSLAQSLGAKPEALDAVVTLAYNQGLGSVPAIGEDFSIDKEALKGFLSEFQTKNSFLFLPKVTPPKDILPGNKVEDPNDLNSMSLDQKIKMLAELKQ